LCSEPLKLLFQRHTFNLCRDLIANLPHQLDCVEARRCIHPAVPSPGRSNLQSTA